MMYWSTVILNLFQDLTKCQYASLKDPGTKSGMDISPHGILITIKKNRKLMKTWK